MPARYSPTRLALGNILILFAAVNECMQLSPVRTLDCLELSKGSAIVSQVVCTLILTQKGKL